MTLMLKNSLKFVKKFLGMADNIYINDNELSFDDLGHENGTKYWWASEYSKMLGYSSYTSFLNPVNKAIKACMTANIPYLEDFRHEQRIVDGSHIDDIKLSRFACYMVAMNSDTKKIPVAKAQAYFADQVEKINIILDGSKDIERLTIREDIKDGYSSLNSAAKNAGVVNFGLFHDAGYKGLYNRGIGEVKKMKGIKPSADHFEHMGRTELSANLFRITMTEERLKNQPLKNEKFAMDIHKKVGKEVREIVIRNTGKTPEELQAERKLGDVKKDLKKIKALNDSDIDKTKKNKRK